MCGICGFSGDIENKATVLEDMKNKIIHRGPDSGGSYINDGIALGFRRLSIIDLDGGSQPIYNETGDKVITFNGEIYNYEALREELIKKGHVFSTNTDTEVILHGYEEYGEGILDKLRGMFAFVIWDAKDGSLFGARDFFGIKPFYYSVTDKNEFVYGSEIKSILVHPNVKKMVNEVALENYLTFQYSVLEETFFKGIFKLMPSHFFRFKDGNLEIKRYYDVKFEEQDWSLEELVNKIDEAVQDSVVKHKVSDVEVGSFLSSGVDSSYVAASFHGDKTFTVGFDYAKYNEIDYAKSLSEKIGIENHSKLIDEKEYWDAIPKVQYHMDEPLADPSAIALYFVSKKASEYVKVALSGEGADEFFGGYNIYREPDSLKVLTSLPKPLRAFCGLVGKAMPRIKGKSFLMRGSKDVEARFIGNAFMFTEEERNSILKRPSGKYRHEDLTAPFYEKVKNKDDVTKMQYIDINFWLIGDILLKADKMSMANSLEVRVPFLDKRVFDVARTIPKKYKVNKENTKYAFRQAANRYLPDMVAEKKKLGFPTPIRVWLSKDEYYNKVRECFSSEYAGEFFKQDEILRYLEEHKNGVRDNSRKIWTIYMFLVWYKNFFIDYSRA